MLTIKQTDKQNHKADKMVGGGESERQRQTESQRDKDRQTLRQREREIETAESSLNFRTKQTDS